MEENEYMNGHYHENLFIEKFNELTYYHGLTAHPNNTEDEYKIDVAIKNNKKEIVLYIEIEATKADNRLRKFFSMTSRKFLDWRLYNTIFFNKKSADEAVIFIRNNPKKEVDYQKSIYIKYYLYDHKIKNYGYAIATNFQVAVDNMIIDTESYYKGRKSSYKDYGDKKDMDIYDIFLLLDMKYCVMESGSLFTPVDNIINYIMVCAEGSQDE